MIQAHLRAMASLQQEYIRLRFESIEYRKGVFLMYSYVSVDNCDNQRSKQVIKQVLGCGLRYKFSSFCLFRKRKSFQFKSSVLQTIILLQLVYLWCVYSILGKQSQLLTNQIKTYIYLFLFMTSCLGQRKLSSNSDSIGERIVVTLFKFKLL